MILVLALPVRCLGVAVGVRILRVAWLDYGHMFIRQSWWLLDISCTLYVNVDLGSEVDSLARAVRLEIWTSYEPLVAGSSLFGVCVA